MATAAPNLPTSDRELPPVLVHPIQPGEEEGLIEVMRASFGGWPQFPIPGTSRDYLEWYLEPHESVQGRVVVGVLDGRVVGANTSIARPVWMQGGLHPASLGTYDAVHPDARGKGVYSAMIRRPRDIDLTWWFSEVEAVYKAYAHLEDFIPIGNPLHVVVRIHRPLVAASSRRAGKRLVNAAGYAALGLRGSIARRPSRAQVSVVSVTRFDERVDRLWEEAAPAFDFIPLRNAEFLNWRYLDGRSGAFTAIAVEEEPGGRVLGYAILRLWATRGHIVDLLTLPGRPDVVRALVDAAAREFVRGGASGTQCMLPVHHEYNDALRRAGFVTIPGKTAEVQRKFGVSARLIAPSELQFLASPSVRLHIFEGDSDLI